MTKYGYEVIPCSKLDINYVNRLSINGVKKLVIQVKNTKYIDKEALRFLQKRFNTDIKISVVGPYNDENVVNARQKEKYFYDTLYSPDELYKIITQFEAIEKNIDRSWNQFDIVVYLIETIVRNIMYDPEYLLMHDKGKKIPTKVGTQDMSDYYDRTLRGMLTRKTVCAGFSVIFKELANRNGVDCKYVSGNGHAWNLIRINGVIYPIDVTWKNTKYRHGDFSNIDYISCDIERFKRSHKPSDPNDNIGLTKIDEEIVKKSKKKTVIRKHYNATTYIITRDDKTKFVLSQIGMYRGLFRYLYADINNDGSYSTPTILFSKSNLAKEVSDHNFEENDHYEEFLKSFGNVLFSKENLNDSRSIKNTRYIGGCELSNQEGYVKKCSEISKSEKAIKAFNMNNIKSQRRNDGSTITLVQFPNKTNNGLQYEYFVYVLAKGPTVMEYNIYSNANYFLMSPNIVVNSLLSDDNLRNSVSSGGIVR